MPEILNMPRWLPLKWEEAYAFTVSGDKNLLQDSVRIFFESCYAGEFSTTQTGFEFSIQIGWKKFFSISEKKADRDVTVGFGQVQAQPSLIRVTIRHQVRAPIPLPTPRIGNSQLFYEVMELETWLKNGANRELLRPKIKVVRNRRHLLLSPGLWLFYRVYRTATWLTFWTKRRFTTAGQAMLGAVIVALFAGMDSENAVGYQAFIPLLGLLMISLCFQFGFRVNFLVQRQLPRVATAGSTVRYSITIKNLSRKRQVSLTIMEDLMDPRPDFLTWREFKLDEDKHVRPFRIVNRNFNSPFKNVKVKESPIPDIAPDHEDYATVELVPLKRGVLRFTGVTIGRPDPLGLFRALKRQNLPQSLLVLPKRYPIPPIAMPGSMKYQQGGVAMASNIGQSEEFVSLREYRRGDPPRHIHWRSWARIGKPIVKEFEDEFFVRHALILDTFTRRPHSEVFEEAISVAASFACTVLTQESLLDLLFVGPEAFCFTTGRGVAHADQMLEILASVQPCASAPFDHLEQLVMNHSSTVSGCICVFLAWDNQRQRLVEKLRAVGLPVLVFVIRGAGESTPLDPGVMSDAPSQLRSLEVGKIEEQLAHLT